MKNETKWIVGGGVAILALAGFLYMNSGSTIPLGSEIPQTKISVESNPPVATTTSADASSSTPVHVSQNEIKSPVSETVPSKDTVTLHTSKGVIVLKLYTKDAPKTAANFLTLVDSKFYNGIKFHRVIDGFMIQAGDPVSKDDTQKARWGSGGPGYKFNDEINPNSPIYKKGYVRGVLAMANSGPNTNGSQFFIEQKDQSLPPAYTIFGEVVSGLDVVDAIATAPRDDHDRPLSPIVITSAESK